MLLLLLSMQHESTHAQSSPRARASAHVCAILAYPFFEVTATILGSAVNYGKLTSSSYCSQVWERMA